MVVAGVTAVAAASFSPSPSVRVVRNLSTEVSQLAYPRPTISVTLTPSR